MTPTRWHYIDDLPGVQHPRLYTLWPGFEIATAYMRDPKTKRLTFFDLDAGTALGGPVRLPTKVMRKHGCGDLPDGWRPWDAETYRWPGGIVPAPLPAEIRPGMRSLKRGVGNREIGSGEPEPAGPEPTPCSQLPTPPANERKLGTRWWKDAPQLVTYAASGEPVSQEEVEGRVCRALLTLAVLPDPEQRFLYAGDKVNWPATADTAEEQRWQRENHDNLDPRPARFEPRKQDIADARENGAPLLWFARLNPPQLRPRGARAGFETGLQRIVRGHALGDSWRKLGARAQDDYGKAIEALHRIANGRQPFPHVTLRDEMAELRQRNREHRNGGGAL